MLSDNHLQLQITQVYGYDHTSCVLGQKLVATTGVKQMEDSTAIRTTPKT